MSVPPSDVPPVDPPPSGGPLVAPAPGGYATPAPMAAPGYGLYAAGSPVPMTSQPRKRRAWLIVGITAAVALLVAYGVVLVVLQSRLPEPAASGRIHTGQLTRFLLVAPMESTYWEDKPPIESLDVDGAAKLFVDHAAASRLLHQYGFQDAAVVRWITPGNSKVEIRLFRFDSQVDAAKYHRVELASDESGSWGTPTACPGVPDAKSFKRSGLDSTGTQSGLHVATAGDISIAVVVAHEPPLDLSVGQQLLAEQYAML